MRGSTGAEIDSGSSACSRRDFRTSSSQEDRTSRTRRNAIADFSSALFSRTIGWEGSSRGVMPRSPAANDRLISATCSFRPDGITTSTCTGDFSNQLLISARSSSAFAEISLRFPGSCFETAWRDSLMSRPSSSIRGSRSLTSFRKACSDSLRAPASVEESSVSTLILSRSSGDLKNRAMNRPSLISCGSGRSSAFSTITVRGCSVKVTVISIIPTPMMGYRNNGRSTTMNSVRRSRS